jgi:ParB family chromosome partitioning protein
MTQRKALGKGLSALIPGVPELEETSGTFLLCPIEKIEPNPYQPRQDFAPSELEEMAQSVREKGILTPLLVSKIPGGYRLIAGERRWRAAQKAGLTRVPVVVKEVSGADALELALIENIHRKDLNPIEEAAAYQRLLEETGATHEGLSRRLGKDRATVTNLLRLLRLPPLLQKDVVEGRLSAGHARVLAGLGTAEEQMSLREEILAKGLSVRQIEALVQKSKRPSRPGRRGLESDDYFQSLEDGLKRSLGTKVEIRRQGKRGRIVIHYYSQEELDRLLDLLG